MSPDPEKNGQSFTFEWTIPLSKLLVDIFDAVLIKKKKKSFDSMTVCGTLLQSCPTEVEQTFALLNDSYSSVSFSLSLSDGAL